MPSSFKNIPDYEQQATFNPLPPPPKGIQCKDKVSKEDSNCGEVHRFTGN